MLKVDAKLYAKNLDTNLYSGMGQLSTLHFIALYVKLHLMRFMIGLEEIIRGAIYVVIQK